MLARVVLKPHAAKEERIVELKTAAHERCFAMMSTYLKQAFGDLAEAEDESPTLSVELGRLYTYVTAQAVGEDDASVAIYSYPAAGMNLTPEVMRRLLEMNAEYRFGSLCLDEDGDIFFKQQLPADGLTKGALTTVVKLVSRSSDEIADELAMRFS